MKATITIEKLAELLKEKVWGKGDLKRIYLDRGYNTKKMSTKTYIYEADGEFKVSCFVDCYNQREQWCVSQANEVKDSVKTEIEKAVFESENPDKNFYETKEEAAAAIELLKEKAEFDKNKETLYEGFKSDFNRAKERNEDIANQTIAFNSLTEADKIEIEKIRTEMAAILGQPGSAKTRKELGNKLNKYPSQPMELNTWMKEAITFENEQKYADFQIEKRVKSFEVKG